ncbi:hypothetical protein [Deinococcus actinosclerus]|uniref:DUF2339 domain-containing protein n=1 Tax=Deinococcus actinosclerus TaxID=1768108 RepID=A0ABN4K1Z8_9DEIO|nr:hypothetical protein [Deinococcus actinosclerus]ALW88178.1 hypothetical protein AUC44_04110 [Deinococcus actinosclerus]
MALLTELLFGTLLIVLVARSVRTERKLDEALRRLDALRRAAPPAPEAAALEPAAAGVAPAPPVAAVPRPDLSPPAPQWAAPASPAAPGPVTPLHPGGQWPDPVDAARAVRAAPAELAAPPVWPDDPPPRPPRRRWLAGVDLGAPAFSRARMSVIGGGLVIAGLAWTLRSLALPGWTTLAAVYAFAALLWWTARGVPQPVAGALRGLGYAAAALGLGGLAQHLGAAGPGAVMAGLLLLSALMARRSVQAGEPLLAAMAGAGAAVSSWMLGDDLGAWAPLVMGLSGLIPALAVPALLRGLAADAPDPGQVAPGLPRASSLVLTLLIAAGLPAGQFVAALAHVPGPLTLPGALHLTGPGPWAWVAGTLLACGSAAALLRWGARFPLPRDTGATSQDGAAAPPALLLGAALAASTPLLVAAAALGGGAQLNLNALPGLLVLCAAGVALSGWAWRTQRAQLASGHPTAADVAGAVAGGATAGTTSLAAAALLGALGARSRPLAFTGLGLALGAVGLAARSRTWARVGVALTALSALVAAALTASGLVPGPALVWATVAALLGGWGLAGRLGHRGWAPEAQAQSLGLGLAATVFALGGALEAAGTILLLGAALWAEAATRGRLTSGAGGAPLTPLRAGAQLAVLGSTVLLALGTWTWGAGLPPGVTGGTLGLAALTGSLLALLASRADPSPTGRAPRDGTPGREAAPPAQPRPALPLAPASQQAAWAGTGLLLFTLGLWLGLDGVSSVGLALAALAVAGHRLNLRRAATLSRSALAVGAGVVGAAVLSGLLSRAADPGRGTDVAASWFALPLAALALLAGWALLHTPTGRRLWTRWTPPAASLPPLPARVWRAPLLGGGVALGVSALWLLFPASAGLRLDGPLGTLGSLGALITGVLVALGAWRWGGVGRGGARPLWDMGVGVGAAAGVKAALLDARLYELPRVATGLAVLVTGLALLLLAVRAPRPDAGEGQEGQEEDSGAGRVPQPGPAA